MRKKLSEAKASSAALKAGTPYCEAEAKAQAIAKRNMYDRGSFQNVSEIVFPLSSRPHTSCKHTPKPKSE